jgi:hypothetical protein
VERTLRLSIPFIVAPLFRGGSITAADVTLMLKIARTTSTDSLYDLIGHCAGIIRRGERPILILNIPPRDLRPM